MSDRRRVRRGTTHIGYVYWDKGARGYSWEMAGGTRGARFFETDFEAEEDLTAAHDRQTAGIPLAPGGFNADPDDMR